MSLLRVLLLAGVACLLSCAQLLPEQSQVRRAVDGDTIELADGRLVRYIGIDTPEVRRRARPGDREWRAGEGDRWVVDPEPYGQEATEANRRFVEGKAIRLEYDVQTQDQYGRLLAYVYTNGQMVNAKLLQDGYAQLLTIPPNVKYAALFQRLAEEARQHKRGLWALD